MATFFLILIYITFISLGLPDSLLGSAWPVMRLELGAPLDAAGLVSMTIAAGTIVSSLLSDRMTKRFGAGKVSAVSVLATAAALLGFSFSPSYGWLILLAIPLGLGAGAVDAALNNYVALHYSARHMSWLHCFWGIGAAMGPVLMALFLAQQNNWRGGFLAVACIQFVITALLFATLPLWKKQALAVPQEVPESKEAPKGKKGVWRLPGVVAALFTFFLYCSVENAAALWGSSVLVEARGFAADVAASGPSVFYAALTAGRFFSGVIVGRVRPVAQIRAGGILTVGGVLLYALPLPGGFTFAALALMGLGCAPIFPCMLHETPRRFGVAYSQKIIGLQMACAYVGITFVPPLIGFVAERVGAGIIPVLMLPLAVLLLFCSQWVDRAVGRRKTT